MVLGGIPPGRVGRRRNIRETVGPAPQVRGRFAPGPPRARRGQRSGLRYDRLSCHLPAVPFGAARRLAPVGREMVADRQRRGLAPSVPPVRGARHGPLPPQVGDVQATTRTDPTAPGVRRPTDPVSATVRDGRRRRAGAVRPSAASRRRATAMEPAGELREERAGAGTEPGAEGRLDLAGPRAAGPARLAPRAAGPTRPAPRTALPLVGAGPVDPLPPAPGRDHPQTAPPLVGRRPPAPGRVDHPQTARPRGGRHPPAPLPADHPRAAPHRTGRHPPAPGRVDQPQTAPPPGGRRPLAPRRIAGPSTALAAPRPVPLVHPEPRRGAPPSAATP